MPTKKNKRTFDSRFKAKVAIEAIKGQETLAQIASRHRLHANQISKWKKQVIDRIPELFSNGMSGKSTQDESLISALYEEIGRLKFELDWLKKKSEYFS